MIRPGCMLIFSLIRYFAHLFNPYDRMAISWPLISISGSMSSFLSLVFKRNFLLILKENAEKAKATIENGLSTYIVESDDVPPNARMRPTQSSKKSHQSFVSLF